MKTKLALSLIKRAALLLLLSTINHQLSTFAQGTAFTYQGRLNDGINPASGTYNLRFALFDALTVGNQVGSPLTNSPVNVSNGLFTVTLDFGANFPGADRWLEIGVSNNGNGTFSTLSPRQKITPTPYAITAGNLNGALPSASLSGTYANAVTLNNGANSFSGNGANLSSLNASQLGSGTVPAAALGNAWRIGGNAGTTPGTQFLGTTDNLPMEFKVNGTRALRLEPNPNAPNVIGGSAANEVTNGLYGAVIAGGGSSFYPNRVGAIFGTVVGGNGNTASGNFATAMGQFNTASGYAGTAMGYSTVAGGFGSQAGGTLAKANHDGTFVWADDNFADFTSTAANQFLIRAANGVGINTNSPNGAALAVNGNVTVAGILSATGLNTAMLNTTEIGTPGNQPLELRANGQLGLRLDSGATAADLTAPGNLAFGSQTRQMLNLYGDIYGIGVQSTRLYFRTAYGPDDGFAWFHSGTHSDTADDPGVGGQELMTLTLNGLVVSGAVNGVQGATTNGSGSGVYGQNDGDGYGVAGRTTGTGSAVYGDNLNTNGWAGYFNGNVSVAGNQFFGSQKRQMLNLSGTQYGIGVQASTLYFRCNNDDPLFNGFVWYRGGVHNDNLSGAGGSGGGTTMMSLVASGLYVNGGALFSSGIDSPDQMVRWFPGNASWSFSSDRNLKDRLAPVNQRDVLAKVCGLSITEWSYIGYDQRHIGPMAQDFHAQFPLNASDTSLNDADLHGVALAAIQGLNAKVEEKLAAQEAALYAKETRITKLEKELAELKQLFVKLSTKQN